MLNIIIPMAGRGSRFADQGFALPKPLIDVGGKSMIDLVIHNLKPKEEHKFIFLVLKEHIDTHAIDQKLKASAPNCEIVAVDQVTEGAACTVLLAKDHVNNNNPLMIANSDQWVDIDINTYLKSIHDADGLIMTMFADHPKWSYVRLSENNAITEVVEKEVVSNEATVGIYNFARGANFVAAAENMIAQDLRVNGEFYVAPVYNEMIKNGMTLRYHNIGAVGDGMYGLGTPEDYTDFLSRKAILEKATNF